MKKLILIVLALSYKGLVYSQETENVNDSTMKKITLTEMVISANKVEEDKKQIAQQIESITSLQIKKANAQNTADLLQQTGFVNVQKSQQGGGSIMMRGLGNSFGLQLVSNWHLEKYPSI